MLCGKNIQITFNCPSMYDYLKDGKYISIALQKYFPEVIQFNASWQDDDECKR